MVEGLVVLRDVPQDGSRATLEHWFDARRLRDDYVPTGFKGYGVKNRAVPGHEFGLNVSAEDNGVGLASGSRVRVTNATHKTL